MGLLDSLGGLASQATQGQTGGGQAGLVQAVLGMLGRSGGGGLGGLGGLVQQFEQAGLGQTIQSWIGNGQNLPISADQLKQVLGHGKLAELAQSAGLSHDDAANHLSQVLPGLVDNLTPNGQLPSGGLDGALSALSAQLKPGA